MSKDNKVCCGLNQLEFDALARYSSGMNLLEISIQMELSEITIAMLLNSATKSIGAASIHEAVAMFNVENCNAA